MSSTGETRCSGQNSQGEPCGAPSSLVSRVTGLCPAHAPGGLERLRDAGRRGAEATARRFRNGGLAPDDLPPLRSPQDAERWAEVVGRAVAERRLTHSEGRAVASLIREFLKAHSDGKVTRRIEELGEAVAKLRADRADGATA